MNLHNQSKDFNHLIIIDWQENQLIDIDYFKSELIDIDYFKSQLIYIDYFKSQLIDIDYFKSELIDIDYFKSQLIDIDYFKSQLIGIDYFKSQLIDIGYSTFPLIEIDYFIYKRILSFNSNKAASQLQIIYNIVFSNRKFNVIFISTFQYYTNLIKEINERSTTLADILSIETIPCDYSDACKLSCVRILRGNLLIWTTYTGFLNALRRCRTQLYKTRRHLHVNLNCTS